MAAEKVTVYIDPQQIKAQKKSSYNLYLAKMVNGAFTVIWQSYGAVAAVNKPSYEPRNDFDITVPNYEVNYGNVTQQSGSVSFTSSGIAETISLGQSVKLDNDGLFDSPSSSGGTAGEITINNGLEGNPNVILFDAQGNPIFVDTASGMDVGQTTLTPIDTYQVWFASEQDTGTIIAKNVSNVGTVTFSGGTTEQAITYNAAGDWVPGAPSETLDLMTGDTLRDATPVAVLVLATFKYTLTLGAVTYLSKYLMDKFASGLKPSQIKVDTSGLTVTFDNKNNRAILAKFGFDKFESAVNSALKSAQADSASGLKNETWSIKEPSLTVFA